VSARPAVSAHCGGGHHHQCIGNLQNNASQWVRCQCPVTSCLCYQLANQSGPGVYGRATEESR